MSKDIYCDVSRTCGCGDTLCIRNDSFGLDWFCLTCRQKAIIEEITRSDVEFVARLSNCDVNLACYVLQTLRSSPFPTSGLSASSFRASDDSSLLRYGVPVSLWFQMSSDEAEHIVRFSQSASLPLFRSEYSKKWGRGYRKIQTIETRTLLTWEKVTTGEETWVRLESCADVLNRLCINKHGFLSDTKG